MKKILGFAMIGAFALNIGTAMAGTASSAVDGGWWIRGSTNTEIISKYTHYTKQAQASTVTGKSAVWKRGPWVAKDKVSNGSQKRLEGGSNEAYYNYR